MTERLKVIFCSMFVWGILAHGFMFFNKFSFHDDASALFGMNKQVLLSQGRWGGAAFAWLSELLFTYDLSLPVFKGFFMIFFLALFWSFFSKWLDLNNAVGLAAVGGVLITCVTSASCLGYMFSSVYLGINLLLSLAGCWLICRAGRLVDIVCGVFLCAFAIGMYQADFIYVLTFFIFFMIKETLEDKYSNKEFWLAGIKYVLLSACSLAVYLVVNQAVLIISGITMSDYYGLNELGKINISEYLQRLYCAYAVFFNPNKFTHGLPYPGSALAIYRVIICILFYFLAAHAAGFISRSNRKKAVQLIILSVLFPLVEEFLILLSPEVWAHSMFSQNFVYVLIFLLIEYAVGKECGEKLRIRLVSRIYLSALFLLSVVFSQYDNACYLKAGYLQEHAISYFNTMITRIQMVEGYTGETPVYFMQPRRRKEIDAVPDEFSYIQTEPYGANSLANNYAWMNFILNWCNFKQPVIYDVSEYVPIDTLEDMPLYPDDGSIQMINGIIIVKFNEPDVLQ